ncbi:MAG: hypothetical protein KF693_10715 [Nitrospira sp.]|nr:hypothetical protein [Nitrospira sp.]
MTRSVLIWALLLCIVLVNGAMAAPSVGHAEHHADHQAGTHSTGLCAWLCAGGQGVESSAVVVTSTLQLVERVVVSQYEAILDPGTFSHFFRGPPVVLS